MLKLAKRGEKQKEERMRMRLTLRKAKNPNFHVTPDFLAVMKCVRIHLMEAGLGTDLVKCVI